MNKKTVSCILLINAYLMVLIAGCDSSNTQTLVVPEEKLRQIGNFQPEKSTEQQTQTQQAPQEPPEEIELALDNCRAAALKYNLDLKAQLIAPTIAQESVNQELAKFEWVFNAGVSKTKTDSPIAKSTDGSKEDLIRSNLGVTMPLQTGGELKFDLYDRYYETNNAFATLNPSYSNDLAVSISQPLLMGAGKKHNTHSIRVAQYDSQIVDAQTKLQVINVLAAAERVYWRLYHSRRQLQLRKDEFDLANAQLERANHLVEVGELPKIEVLRAQAGLAQRLRAIILADNMVRLRQRELKRALNIPGLDVDSKTKIITVTLPDPVDYQFDADRLTKAAIENRMEMLQLELNLAKSSSELEFLKNLTLPALSVDYRYNINGLGSSRKDSFDMVWDKNFEDHRIGMNLSIPLGNKVAKSRLLQAKYARLQTLTTKQGQISLIQLEVLAAIDSVKAAWQQILASRQSAILQGQVYEAEIRQFESGLRTSTDVLEAQANLADAQSQEINALTEYQISLVDMAQATGTALGAAKVEWQPETNLTLMSN